MHIILDVEGTISINTTNRLYGPDSISHTDGTITYFRDHVIHFMELCLDNGHDISLWSDRGSMYANEVASYFKREYDIEFKSVLDRRHRTMNRKSVYDVGGDLLLDDDINNYKIGDPYIIVPTFMEGSFFDFYFSDLISKFRYKDDWSVLDFM